MLTLDRSKHNGRNRVTAARGVGGRPDQTLKATLLFRRRIDGSARISLHVARLLLATPTRELPHASASLPGIKRWRTLHSSLRDGGRVGNPGDRYLLEALESEGVLRAYLFRYVRNPADVDELLQETYAKLLVAHPSGGEVRSVRALALTIARNLALDWLRHRDVVPMELVSDLASLDVLDEKAQVEEIVNSHQELALLADVIGALPKRSRQVFTLRRVYGLSQREIAQRLGIGEKTVEQMLARAVRRCAQILFAREVAADRPQSMSERLRRRLRVP
jgi:RNA polymerase sigma factor (sigma-70 family)